MAKKDKHADADHRRRLAWAKEHLDALEADIGAFLESDPYQATEQFDAQGGDYVGRIRVSKDVPPEWSLRVGDIVHNLRSSLDNLAYALSVAHSGEPTEAQARDIQFLLCDTKAEFDNPRRHRYVERMSLAAQAEMERIQPYNTKPKGFKHHLSVLRDLSNIDKHRHIVLTRAAAESANVQVTGPEVQGGTQIIGGFTGPFEDGTVIARWKFQYRPTAKMDVRVNLAVVIEFADGPAKGGTLPEFPAAVIDYIRDNIFPPLEAHL